LRGSEYELRFCQIHFTGSAGSSTVPAPPAASITQIFMWNFIRDNALP